MTTSAERGPILAISAGGTRLEAVVALDLAEVRAPERRAVLATGSPQESIDALLDALAPSLDDIAPRAVGIASFGPLRRETGQIAATPKPGWSGFDWRTHLVRRLGSIPVVVDTDVNAACLAEYRHGAAVGADLALYLTVGTGIGGGIVTGGALLRSSRHPEMGHLRVPRLEGDSFPGSCPFHGDCLEGLASGAALRARSGRAPEKLDDDDPVWALEARYLAFGISNLELALGPDIIVVGGGVTARPGLLTAVRERYDEVLAGYRGDAHTSAEPSTRVVAPALGRDPEIIGAYELARDELHRGARG